MKFSIFSLLLLCGFVGVCQDIQLSQFHVADMLLNPALAGSKNRNRAMFHQRFQWPGVDGEYNTSFISYDNYLNKYRIGFGGFLTHDNQGEGIMKTTSLSFLLSHEVHLSKTWALRLGVQGGFFRKSVNDKDLIYPDQVTPDGIVGQQSENLGVLSYSQPDFAGGAVIYNEKFWFSSSYYHFNKPQQRFLTSSEVYPVKVSFISGYKIPLGHISPALFTGYRKEFYLFPTIHYKFQGKSDQLEIGADMIDDQLRIGLWYRGILFKKYESDLQNNESFVVLAGWRYKNLEVVYSYDIVISRLTRARTNGAHEIHVSFIWPLETPHHNFKKLPCPDFQKSERDLVGDRF